MIRADLSTHSASHRIPLSGLGRTRVSEMRSHRASARLIRTANHRRMLDSTPMREDLDAVMRPPA